MLAVLKRSETCPLGAGTGWWSAPADRRRTRPAPVAAVVGFDIHVGDVLAAVSRQPTGILNRAEATDPAWPASASPDRRSL